MVGPGRKSGAPGRAYTGWLRFWDPSGSGLLSRFYVIGVGLLFMERNSGL
jgi:hypothetical protein